MDKELSRIVNIIVKETLPEKIVLFGSRAKHTADEASDYDLFIIVNNGGGMRKIEKKLYFLLTKAGIGTPVDLIVETRDKFERLKNNQYLIYSEVDKFGQTIYEK
jgi:predicted nucleotidyltransferase